MAQAIKTEFCIAAAKSFDYDEATGRDFPNWSYIDDATDCVEALKKFNLVRSYPIVEFHLETTFDDGSRIRVPVFGGVTEKLVNGRWQSE